MDDWTGASMRVCQTDMTEYELTSIIQEANAQYAVLYGHVLTISFAVIVATHYFLCTTRHSLRLAVFLLYSIGMLTFVALFLQNANLKSRALSALAAIPDAERSQFAQSIVDFSHHWLFVGTGIVFNLSLWVIWLATAAMLFFSKETPSHPKAE
jgi:hypothetical protein